MNYRAKTGGVSIQTRCPGQTSLVFSNSIAVIQALPTPGNDPGNTLPTDSSWNFRQETLILRIPVRST